MPARTRVVCVSSVPPLLVVVGYWRFGAVPRAVPVVWNTIHVLQHWLHNDAGGRFYILFHFPLARAAEALGHLRPHRPIFKAKRTRCPWSSKRALTPPIAMRGLTPAPWAHPSLQAHSAPAVAIQLPAPGCAGAELPGEHIRSRAHLLRAPLLRLQRTRKSTCGKALRAAHTVCAQCTHDVPKLRAI